MTSCRASLGESRFGNVPGINVLPLKIPALAERVADIPLLARHFAEEYALLHGDAQVRLEPAFLDALSQRSWPEISFPIW